MATKKDARRTRIDNIKTDLRSVSTCTPSTVADLQDLLAEKTEDVVQKENVKLKSSRLLSVETTSRRRAVSATVTAAATAVKQTVTSLAPREKYLLSTEVANITLKSLADALKSQPIRVPTKSIPPSKDNAPTSTKSQPARSRGQKPLQERSISQAINSPVKPSSLRRSVSCSTSPTAGPDAGLVATAACARIAFAYLRTPEAVKVAGRDSPTLQLESGILALVGKLVAHGLDNLAIKELRTLKRRLDHFIQNDKSRQENQGTNTKAPVKRMLPQGEKESLASLLRFEDLDCTSPALSLVVTLQTYTLRIIAKTRCPRLVEEAWNYLKLSNACSPANLLRQTAKASNADAKAARQLESLAQTIHSLCPSIASSEDTSADQNELYPSPDLVLNLQHLAFKIRQTWWKLAKHQGNEEKELLEPFSKCVVAFARRSKLSSLKKYKVAELLLLDLLRPEDISAISQRQNIPSSITLAARTLSSLAQSAGLADEALKWLASSASPETGKESSTTTAIRHVRTATLHLDASFKGAAKPDLKQTIDVALAVLSGTLSGSSSELDSMFTEVNAFRRSASRALSASNQAFLESSQLQHEIQRIISACVHFTRRYLGTSAPIDNDVKVQTRYKQQVMIMAKHAKSILDSCCVYSKLPVKSVPETKWTDMDGLLQDCLLILRHFQERSASALELPDDVQQPFVKLSNAYWAVHLQLKLAMGISDVSTSAMERSVNVLRDRSEAEQQSGLLTMKLERLGEALDSLARVEGSREALVACIEHMTRSDIFKDALEAANEHPIQQVFENNEPRSALARVLKTLHRSFLQHGIKESSGYAFFDSAEIAAAGRGMLLEWQLALYFKTLSKNRSWDPNLNSSIQAISARLEEVYVPDKFPVRRRRVQIMLLQLSHERPDVIPQTLLQPTMEPDWSIRIADTEDKGLARYGSHLNAFMKLKTAMRSSCLTDTPLQECLNFWQSLISSTPSWTDLLTQVDNVEIWLADLQAVADRLVANGEEYTSIPVLSLVVRILELERNADPSRLITNLCALALQLLRLGYTGKAGSIFAKAESLSSNNHTSTEAKLEWHLGYAEYLLSVGNTAKCQSMLSAAQIVAQSDNQFTGLAKPSTTLSGRVRFNKVLADACYVHSLLSSKTGFHKDAARYAKQSVALSRRVWAALESRSSSKKIIPSNSGDTNDEGSSNAAFDPLSSMRNDKGIPLVLSVTHESLDGPDFWSLVPRLYRCLMQQSQVFTHQGLLQEAVYVAEQAEKVASATNSRSLLADNVGRRAGYWVESGRVDKARAALESFNPSSPFKHVSMASYYYSQAKIHRSEGHLGEELAALDILESILNDLSLPPIIKGMDISSSSVQDLTETLSAMTLEKPASKARPPVKSTRTRRPAAKAVAKAGAKPTIRGAPQSVQPPVVQRITVYDECLPLCRMRADVARQKALSKLAQEDIAKALELVNVAEKLEQAIAHNPFHIWTTFKTMLSQSMKALASDFTLNTLPESTIAFPAVGQRDHTSFEAPVPKRANITAALATGRGARSKKVTKQDFITTLREARERLVELHSLCTSTGTSSEFQQVSFSLSRVTVLLSAVSGGDFQGSLHPLYAAYMSEIPKYNSLRLAGESIEVELESKSRDDLLKWPEADARQRFTLATPSEFQKEYIDIIPETWTAISLALNEDHDELYITRYESGQSPFVLRLPLSRHASRDMDEEEFSYGDGKRDFEEIIELSDFSTRSAKDMTSKEARLQWWTEREALDTRLHELLLNIENIWLGGFKGIFSQHSHQPALLARFRKSFDDILSRHLPSRRGKAQLKKSSLDARVLELFIGLGDATNDQVDLDEALMDLIYFVVDILQFNGERNAYDEIDFDAIVIETLDALRAYYNASQGASTNTAHTILILDKSLHIFPWESMPSLQSLSISRLPSLAALRERILAAKPCSAVEDVEPGHYISSAAGGTSILNPSGDLSHTMKTLKPRLDDMQGSWTHIASRSPSEKEFEDALKNDELVLYFGHGSGAQFVRSKSVRRLYPGSEPGSERPRCATTFLFGCSSAHLTENGIYEPSGMLASYLIAGAPAVVGMLWDVTDKDCDRFAIKVGELWGLWPELKEEDVDALKTANKSKSKGKGKVAQLVAEVETARGTRAGKKSRKDGDQVYDGNEQFEGLDKRRRKGVGLDEAVRKARDACHLRYLNGAAAVVYGIPVYMK